MMTIKKYHYQTTVTWTGNQGKGTEHYSAYRRDHTISAPNKPDVLGSADAAFLGDEHRWHPEGLLLASASACHQLWYLHLCADAGISVLAYVDQATGIMVEDDHTGAFTEITLHPEVTIQDAALIDLAISLHDQAHERCYIANSLRVPIRCEPTIKVGP